MAKIKGVTTAQLEHMRKIAKTKGATRDDFQRAIDSGALALAIEAGIHGFSLAPEILPPPGGRIHVIRIPVVLDRPWNEAVKAAGPNIPEGHYNIWEVGDLYVPRGAGAKEKKFVLVNFGPDGGSKEAAEKWAEGYNLKGTTPRDVFAIGEHKPDLRRELGMDPMYVVSTEEGSFAGFCFVCCVWWRGAVRLAGLYSTESVGCPDVWVAFSRE